MKVKKMDKIRLIQLSYVELKTHHALFKQIVVMLKGCSTM